MEKAEVKNSMDLRNESCFQIKAKVLFCSNTVLQHPQNIFSLFLLEKFFCCRSRCWLISWKNSQDDSAGLCLIKCNRRLNKWTNQEGTYVRAPCPGFWELGPQMLPKLTVLLYGICHELKDHLKRREADALQFSCLKTSITAGFLLLSMEAGMYPSPWHSRDPPQDCSILGGRRQAVQAVRDHPDNLWPGFFRQVLCYTFRKACTGCVTVLKNRLWHHDSFCINLLVRNTKKCLEVFAGKFISLLTELKQMSWHCITLPLFHAFSFSSLCSASNLKWKIPAGDPVFLVVPWSIECNGRLTSESFSIINKLSLFESPISTAFSSLKCCLSGFYMMKITAPHWA